MNLRTGNDRPIPFPMDRRDHWENVYATRTDADLSWHQDRPALSLSLIDALDPPPRRAVDVGGGQSSLAGELLARGFESVAVLDVSESALRRARERLGSAAVGVRWIVGDVLDFDEPGAFDLWHDRAVFHFLTDPADRRRYADVAARTLAPAGRAVIATFAPDGPERCSGLPVRRYDPDALAAEFTPAFRLLTTARETHHTPWGRPQAFTFAVLQQT